VTPTNDTNCRMAAALSVPPDRRATIRMDRLNGLIFFSSYVFVYLAAPVLYVGVVQAALCDKLGASATVSNLPSTAWLFGNLAPLFFASAIPHRLERATVVVSNLLMGVLLGAVCAALAFPLSNTLRIVVVIGQGLILGVTGAISQVYMTQCLGRGTTPEGRVRALKVTFTFTPIAAVVGSLGAQFVLNQGIRVLPYPYDFALLYFIGAICTIGVGIVSTRYELAPVEEEKDRSSLLLQTIDSMRSYSRDRRLVLLWFGYVLWYATLFAAPNLSLHVRQVLGVEPKQLSGLVMMVRFGFKAVAGFFLGAMAIRWGDRAPVIATTVMVGGAVLWGWAVPGYAFLLAFGIMGAGELGGAYYPNYVIGLSSKEAGARNLALLTLATPLASLSPLIHGALTDLFGYPASFAFGITTAAIALWLILKLPSPAKRGNTAVGD
jgi:MFS family permease